MTTNYYDVLVVGSGLAGMSAAVELSDKGKRVLILEANPFIGGRTASWVQDGMKIESGLHRFLGLYTLLPELIEKVGIEVDDIIHWEDEIEVRTIDNLHSTFGGAPLHKPFKTIWNALGHNNFLPPKDKLALTRMFTAGFKDYHKDPAPLDKISVAEYANEHGVSDTTISRILTPLTEGIFFISVKEYSALNFFGLFIPFLPKMHQLRFGAFLGGMTDVMMQPMADFVLKRSGNIALNTPVTKLLVENKSVVGVIAAKQIFKADQVILAASIKGAQNIIAGSFKAHPHFQDMLQLETMPSVTFHIDLTEPGMGIDRTTFGPETCLAAFSEQSRTTFQHVPGRLSVILGEPQKFITTPPDELLAHIIADARRLEIELEGKVTQYRKVVIPHDFYSFRSGNIGLRPPQETPIPGLTLAGDYTKQHHLATMEGAALSGKLAAEIVLSR